MSKRPHILIFNPDQWRGDVLGHMGNPAAVTSNLNRTGLYWPRVSLQQSEEPEHTKAAMCRTKYFKHVRRLCEPDELYDLRPTPER